MKRPETRQSKLERLETLVDALIEERNGLRSDLQQIERPVVDRCGGLLSHVGKMLDDRIGRGLVADLGEH